MMTGRTLFRNYKEYDQKEVEICGWVKSNRGSKKFGFLVINDGTFFEPIQVVYDQEMDNFDTVSKLNVGTAVIVNGTVIVTPDAKQPFEIHAKSVEVEGECPSDYPLQKKRPTLEYLSDRGGAERPQQLHLVLARERRSGARGRRSRMAACQGAHPVVRLRILVRR